MRIALVQPVIEAGKSLGVFKVPEGIMALAGQLNHLGGFEVRQFHEPVNDELVREIVGFRPEAVGVSTMTPSFPAGVKIARRLKARMPETPIILGGWHATGCVQSYLEGQETETLGEILGPASLFDFVVSGEGEEVLPQLLTSISRGRSAGDVPGVSFMKDGQIIARPSAPRIKKLGEIGSPSWTDLNMSRYRDGRSGALDLSVHFNRGCRFQCAFCATPTSYGRGVVSTPAPEAVAYMERLLVELRPSVITFTDEDFFAHPQWVEQLVELMLEADLVGRYGVAFDTFASINDMIRLARDEHGSDLVLDMRRAGFRSFTVGIESFNPAVLLRYKKDLMAEGTMTSDQRAQYRKLEGAEQARVLAKHYLDRAQEAINFATSLGMWVVGDYMLGSMGESEQEVRQGFELFKDLNNLLIAYLPVFTPYPGTGLWKEAYQSGQLPRTQNGSIDWTLFDVSAGALDVGYDIGALRNELEVDFYTSSRYQRDMSLALVKNSALRAMFADRFKYLDETFPGDPRVQAVLDEMC